MNPLPPVIGNSASIPAVPGRKYKGATLLVWLAGLGILVTAGLLFVFDPSHAGFYPRCMLYSTTGLYCPGCGALRATHHLLHGHLLTALRCNPLYILALPWLAGLGFKTGLHRWKNGTWLEWDLNGRTVAWMVVAAIAFTILRNLHMPPFCYLAPAPGI